MVLFRINECETCDSVYLILSNSNSTNECHKFNRIIDVYLRHPILCYGYTIITHHSDVIMGTMVSQITSPTIIYSTVYSGAYQIKHQSSASLAFVRGIHRWPHKGPVTRKVYPFNDAIMVWMRWDPDTQNNCYFADDIFNWSSWIKNDVWFKLHRVFVKNVFQILILKYTVLV